MLSCAILAYTNQNRLTKLPFGLKSFVFPAGTETAMLLALKLVKYLFPSLLVRLFLEKLNANRLVMPVRA